MGHKNQSPVTLNFQSTDPRTGFLPLNANSLDKGSPPSGLKTGTMTGTAVVYSQIIDVGRMDTLGLEAGWTGTPSGAFVIFGSVSGSNWANVTALFTAPSITNPAGSASTSLGGTQQYPFKYFLLQYTNSSGTGSLTGALQIKDLN